MRKETAKTPSFTPLPAPTDAQIVAAMNKGIDFLLLQKKGSNLEVLFDWADKTPTVASKSGVNIRNFGGETSLGLYALLIAGKSLGDKGLAADSKEIAPLVAWLEKLEPASTYVAARQAVTLTLALPAPAKSPALDRDKKYLLIGMFPGGGWRDTNETMAKLYTDLAAAKARNNAYEVKRLLDRIEGYKKNTCGEVGNSQYATLALFTMQEAGLDMPTTLWSDVDLVWHKTQRPDGTWRYTFDTQGISTDSMTIDGLASLLLTSSAMKKDALSTDPAIATSLNTIQEKLRTDSFWAMDSYVTYGLTRTLMSLGIRRIGELNWLDHTAASLIKSQASDGSWNFCNSGTGGDRKLLATSFALLTLAKARVPVAFSMLQLQNTPNLAHARAANNLTSWMTQQDNRLYSWQALSWDCPDTDWQRSQLLIIADGLAPNFTPEQMNQLKQFMDNGGTILSAPEKNSPFFQTGIQKAMQSLATDRYELRDLPPDHDLFKGIGAVKPPKTTALLDKGRPAWIHVNADLSLGWQNRTQTPPFAWSLPLKLSKDSPRAGTTQPTTTSPDSPNMRTGA
ncbi:MAG: hypothetical protein FWD61_19635 [Phycisphaerales bacterium]|nr:hypothetical protein [Phycisphaerales bacterium]